jgi:lipopolysaccharide/colanic/teichoic acid biosynthesis glycosyltransferase
MTADALFQPGWFGPVECPRVRTGRTAQFVAKRALDYGGAVLGLLMLGLTTLAIALAIRLDSGGPVLFRQRRLGLHGKPFWIWKFRTMVVDAEARMSEMEAFNESQCGVLFKIRDDPRVTRVGRFLRRTSLDELPQLFNVLQGQMSLVGPRPLPLRDCERMRDADEARFTARLGVLPGLTGPWQIGGRSEIGYDGMLDLDVDYIMTWSLWRDLRLIARTVIFLLVSRGAY